MNSFLLSFYFFIIIFSTYSQNLYNELQDGTQGITNGYGSWGNYQVIKETEIEVMNKGKINFYHPDIQETQLPVIFFISGWGREAYSYEKFFYFLSSLGYSVVNIYNSNPGNINESYQNSLEMILQSVNVAYPNWINTSKVGLMGHSYGAGSTIWLGKYLFGNDYNWGTDGKFIFMSAPWYSLLVTENDLLNYPSGVKLLIEINNDDYHEGTNNWNTDERAIRAVFELINIPDSEKDFIRVFSTNTTYQFDYNNDGTVETFNYDANHYISYTGVYNAHGYYQPYDALDVYAINRLAHALIDYVFEGNPQAKTVALGNGSNLQTDMGFLTDLSVTDAPVITRPENQFQYKCNTTWNDFATGDNTWFLQNACNDSNNDGIIDILGIKQMTDEYFKIYPVPAKNWLYIEKLTQNEDLKSISINNIEGKTILNFKAPFANRFDISTLKAGMYFVRIKTDKATWVKKIMVLLD